MLRIGLFASVLLLGSAASAMACEGQAGNVIFNDNFADDSGGWDMAGAGLKITPPAMQLTLDKQTSGVVAHNLTFNATDGDYCAEFVLPQQVGNNRIGFGIEFWAADYNNLMIFYVNSDKTANLYKRTAGAWSGIFSDLPAAALKVEPDAVNSIRVLALAGKLTLSVNGQTVKVVRAQVPAGNLRFGMEAQTDTGPEAPLVVNVKSYNVTTGQ